MRMYFLVILTLLLCGLCPGPCVALEFTAAHTGAQKVMLTDHNIAEQLGEILVGDAIDGITSRRGSWASAGGRLVWRMVRDQSDEQGRRHVFYRQRYVLPAADLSQGRADIAEVPLLGAELGLHYDPDGALAFVFGTQFEDAVAVAGAVVPSVAQARSTAMSLIGAWPGFAAMEPAGRTAAQIEADLTKTRPLLVSRGDGITFDLIWEVPIRDLGGIPWIAILDAHSAELIAVENRQSWSTCAPDTNSSANATGNPERHDRSSRFLWATTETTRGPDFTHEAHKVAAYYNPDIQVFDGLVINVDGCASEAGTQEYELMPVKTISGSPRYEYYTSEDIPAHAGGDALWFTYLTMATFKQRGWSSFDNGGTVAKIVIDAVCRYSQYQYIYDNAQFIQDGTGTPYGPDEGVVICPSSQVTYRGSAAIDVVAHEWGHGVIYHSANWTYTGDGADYHEGFADVIGYMVEWAQQSAGSGTERAEWQYGEETDYNRTPIRRVDQDDGTGGVSLHKDDAAYNAHGRGNRLPTAFRLMSVGGVNPVCSRLSSLPGCSVNVGQIGVDKSGRILFKVLTSYATSSTGWSGFGNLAKIAAHYLYRDCNSGYSGETEQQAAIDAFTAIGYPPLPAVLLCK